MEPATIHEGGPSSNSLQAGIGQAERIKRISDMSQASEDALEVDRAAWSKQSAALWLASVFKLLRMLGKYALEM